MRSLRVVMMAVVSMLSAICVHAQTVDDIINKHIEAMGGKDKLASVKTIYTEYDMDVMGNQAAGVTYVVNGKAYRNEIDFGGQKIIQCLTDKGGWGINPMAGQTAAEALPADQVKMSQGQLDVGGPLFNYAAKGNTVELQGKDSVNGVNAFKLKLKGKEGNENLFWIDPSTYYILKSTSKISVNGQDVETGIAFSNYKKTDYGYVVPGTTEVTLPQGLTLNITNKKVEVNKDIDMKMFEMPK
jgi:hypothetical protein